MDHNYSLHKSGIESQSEGQDKASSGSQYVNVNLENHDLLDQQLKTGESNGGNIEMDNRMNSCDNIEMDNRDDSPLDLTLAHPATDNKSTSGVEATVINAVDSCGDSVKQISVGMSLTSSGDHGQQDTQKEDKMDSYESAAEFEAVSEGNEKCGVRESDSEEKLQQDACSDEKSKEKIWDEKEVSKPGVSEKVLNNEDIKSNSMGIIECRQSSSQDKSKDTSEDVKSGSIPLTTCGQTNNLEDSKDNKDIASADLNDHRQIDSKTDHLGSCQVGDCQGTIQDGSQMEESSVEFVAMSCGNQADIETVAMDVDDEDIKSVRHQTFQDSFGSFLAASRMNIVSSDQNYPKNDGFTTATRNYDVSDSIMDTDSFEGNKPLEREQTESCKETKVQKDTDDADACLHLNIQEQMINHIEMTDNKLQIEESNVISVRSDIPGNHRADKDIATNSSFSISHEHDSKKEPVEIPQVQNKSGDANYRSNYQEDPLGKHCMDAAGDLKDSCSKQKLHYQSDAAKEEGEKWETEAQEKSKDELDELPKPVKASGVNNEENLSAYVNDLSTVSQPEVSKTVSCNKDMDTQSYSSTKDSELLKAELISKCRSGLEMCASRFPCHFKSLYRLAYLYYHTQVSL